jgi:hypothetical protein
MKILFFWLILNLCGLSCWFISFILNLFNLKRTLMRRLLFRLSTSWNFSFSFPDFLRFCLVRWLSATSWSRLLIYLFLSFIWHWVLKYSVNYPVIIDDFRLISNFVGFANFLKNFVKSFQWQWRTKVFSLCILSKIWFILKLLFEIRKLKVA